MKVVILAGGMGTRLAEETEFKPKPMVEVGGRPILWHIIKYYAHHGHDEFIVALGYRGEVIKRYFLDYAQINCDFTVDLPAGRIERRNQCDDQWRVQLIDTGIPTLTGGRIKRLANYLGDDTFMLTYGDGLCNVDVDELLRFHRSHGKLATITAVRPPARFGGLDLDGNRVHQFTEKSQIGEGWINGGFFVLEPETLNYIEGDESTWELGPLERLAADGELMAYRHDGFWQCMDTLRDHRLLESLWAERTAPWNVWDLSLQSLKG